MPKAPEQVRVAITFDDGSVGIMQFVTREYLNDGSTRWVRAATHETVAAEIARSAYDAKPVSFRIMEALEQLPDDRYFRNAWRDDGAISVDMSKAREIHRDRLRALRKPLLADLDIAYMRAQEAGDTKVATDVVAQKQTLRDCTDDPRIDAAATPEELKAVIPDALKG